MCNRKVVILRLHRRSATEHILSMHFTCILMCARTREKLVAITFAEFRQDEVLNAIIYLFGIFWWTENKNIKLKLLLHDRHIFHFAVNSQKSSWNWFTHVPTYRSKSFGGENSCPCPLATIVTCSTSKHERSAPNRTHHSGPSIFLKLAIRISDVWWIKYYLPKTWTRNYFVGCQLLRTITP